MIWRLKALAPTILLYNLYYLDNIYYDIFYNRYYKIIATLLKYCNINPILYNWILYLVIRLGNLPAYLR